MSYDYYSLTEAAQKLECGEEALLLVIQKRFLVLQDSNISSTNGTSTNTTILKILSHDIDIFAGLVRLSVFCFPNILKNAEHPHIINSKHQLAKSNDLSNTDAFYSFAEAKELYGLSKNDITNFYRLIAEQELRLYFLPAGYYAVQKDFIDTVVGGRIQDSIFGSL